MSGQNLNHGGWLPLVAAAGFLCCPSYAAAHLVTTGMGPVYDGIGHLLLTPEDLVPVIALAFYAGLRGAVPGSRTMFLLPLAWFAGGIIGSVSGSVVAVSASWLSFLIVGGLVPADVSAPASVVSGVAIAPGLVHGFLNGAALREGPGILGLVGIVVPYMLPLVLLLIALEQAGIMARIAFAVDRGFHRLGLHGGVAVPFLLGLGCNVPALSAIGATTSGRERVVGSLLVTFVPCSARSAIILAVGGKSPWSAGCAGTIATRGVREQPRGRAGAAPR